jgi:hypothetical protein
MNSSCSIRTALTALAKLRGKPAHASSAARSTIIPISAITRLAWRAATAVANEVQSVTLRGDLQVAGYWIPRRNIIFGKEIRFTGWSPDYQPRVLRKGKARFDPARQVHELVVWDGAVGYLREPLIHLNYETLAQFRAKQIKYTQYEAQVWFNEGKRAHLRGVIGQPVREFLRRYISLQGWRDGAHGFLLSALMAYYAFVRWKMLRELGRMA